MAGGTIRTDTQETKIILKIFREMIIVDIQLKLLLMNDIGTTDLYATTVRRSDTSQALVEQGWLSILTNRKEMQT